MDNGCKHILDRIGSHIQKVVQQAGLTFETIHSVEVIGGGMRIPSVQAKVKEVIGKHDLCFSLDSAHCVAIGAGLLAKILNPEFELPFQIVDSSVTAVSKFESHKVEKSIARLATLIERDLLIAKTREKKNELESFIYVIRGKCADSSLPL